MTRPSLVVQDELEATRADLERALLDLQANLADAVDWREWVRRRPLPFLGAAFAVGLVLGWR